MKYGIILFVCVCVWKFIYYSQFKTKIFTGPLFFFKNSKVLSSKEG